jgi:hypothetical protein
VSIALPPFLERLSLDRDIVPLLRLRHGRTDGVPSGTGFIIAPNVLMTCWHCVRDLKSHESIVALERDGDRFVPHELTNLEMAREATDLALASVDLVPRLDLADGTPPGLWLSHDPAHLGADVFAYGYPLPEWISVEGGSALLISPRYLRGYVTRTFRFDRSPAFAPIPAYELDMPAPAGLSGAPLVRGMRNVVGVVFGTNDVGTVESLGRIEPETGKREPEVHRVVSFALAHVTATLWEAAGTATGGQLIGRLATHAP